MKKSTVFLLILVAFLFVSLLFSLYLNFYKFSTASIPTPTPGIIPTETINPLSDWKTYESKTLGFTISYPSDWEINDSQNSVGMDSPESIKARITYPTAIPFDIIIKTLAEKDLPNNIKNLTLDQWITSSAAKEYGLENTAIKILIDKFSGYKGVFCGEFCGTNYFIKKGTKIYEIDLNAENIPEIYNQIISTFKFTESKTENLGNWVKRPNGDYITINNCLQISISKANDNGDLRQYIQNFYRQPTIDNMLFSKQYSVKNSETITIEATGIGEMFTVYFSKNNKKYSILFFNSSVPDNVFREQCEDYQRDIDYVLNNVDFFL